MTRTPPCAMHGCDGSLHGDSHPGARPSNRRRAVQIVEACFENPPMRGKRVAGDFVARYIVAMLIADGLLILEDGVVSDKEADDDAFPMR